jgi:hypothetical protein
MAFHCRFESGFGRAPQARQRDVPGQSMLARVSEPDQIFFKTQEIL